MSTGSYPDRAADDFDWTKGEFAGGSHQAGIDDFEFADAPPALRDADEIERDAASREFRPIEPGDHELFVAGFKEAPKQVHRTGYLNGQQVSWRPYQVCVRLAKVTDPNATILDWFDVPPDDPTEWPAYQQASKNPDGKNPGFGSEKFGHFISRLGWPFPKGGRLPADAKRLGNWKGRRIHATVELERVKAGQERIDQTTGQPFPPRSQVKLYSYRPSEATVQGYAPQGQVRTTQGGQSVARAVAASTGPGMMPAQPAQQAPAAQQRPPARPGIAPAAQQRSLAGSGLENI